MQPRRRFRMSGLPAVEVASASALRADLATVMSGWVDLRWPRRSVLGPGGLSWTPKTRQLVKVEPCP